MALDLQAVTHINVNCSDLERSMAFYRDLVGLAPQSHTKPHPQEGAGFGLPGQVVWDAYLIMMIADTQDPLSISSSGMRPAPSVDLIRKPITWVSCASALPTTT